MTACWADGSRDSSGSSHSSSSRGWLPREWAIRKPLLLPSGQQPDGSIGIALGPGCLDDATDLAGAGPRQAQAVALGLAGYLSRYSRYRRLIPGARCHLRMAQP